MVEPRFAKRTDAKAAVCLQAMSQGVGKYIRSLASAIDSRVTDEMRRLANEQILPILGSEYGRLRHGMHPVYDYGLDNGGETSRSSPSGQLIFAECRFFLFQPSAAP